MISEAVKSQARAKKALSENPALTDDRKKSKFAPKLIGGIRWEVILSRMKSPGYDLQQLLVSYFFDGKSMYRIHSPTTIRRYYAHTLRTTS